MKERKFAKKLVLNKETIASLTDKTMKAIRAGADSTEMGNSCWTGECCYSKIICETDD